MPNIIIFFNIDNIFLIPLDQKNWRKAHARTHEKHIEINTYAGDFRREGIFSLLLFFAWKKAIFWRNSSHHVYGWIRCYEKLRMSSLWFVLMFVFNNL
jgi:hypothetical protein